MHKKKGHHVVLLHKKTTFSLSHDGLINKNGPKSLGRVVGHVLKETSVDIQGMPSFERQGPLSCAMEKVFNLKIT